MDQVLDILRHNARTSIEDIAKMTGMPAEEVAGRIEDYERQGVIRGYRAIVNDDRLEDERVTAVIEVKVQPEREGGFDRVARRIARFPEVVNMYLMSGKFDLLLFVEGDSLKKVASFVSQRLAPLEGILSTGTHFMLRTYKAKGVAESLGFDERLEVS